ncbi:MAG: endo alpha-1,4 polygalactosaminidase [Deltaproteobacteria bacterium]|nr:endo alpha-1,4 polygalactosaminidase [Deltaproteobacteria bacterium]
MARWYRIAWTGLWLAAACAAGCGDDDGASDVIDAPGEDASAEDAPGELPSDVLDDDAAVPDVPGDVPADPGDAPEDRPEADDAADAPDAPPGIWRPAPGTSWQWQLTGTIDASLDVEMYDIDLFEAPQATIDGLRARGVAVICYFSAGSREEWRDDADDFPPAAVGEPLDGWPGESWIDVRSTDVRRIMRARLDLAVAKRCDGVEPDNVDAYANDSGFPLTAAHQLDYNRFLAAEAHARGLSVGLKNDLEQVDELLADFDWALDEECFEWDECELLEPFIGAGKAVFQVEYGAAALADSVCPRANALDFDTLIKNLDLDAWRVPCR